MRRWLAGALLAFRLLAAGEGSPHRLRLHPNPNIKIYSIAEGPDGFLWLAAEDGLYRFDGFHYQKITAYPFGSARFVAFTSDGSLWVGASDGLTRIVKDTFQVLLRQDVSGMAAYPDQLVAKVGFDLVRTRVDASVTRFNYTIRRDLSIDSSGRLWAICIRPNVVCAVDPQRADAIEKLELPPQFELFYQAARDSKGRLWVADGEHAALVDQGRATMTVERQKSRETARSAPLISGRAGQLWFLGETVRGLVSPVEFHDRADHDRFPPMAGLEDSRRHFWVASYGQGLVEWIPDPDWRRWPAEQFAGEPGVQIRRDERGSLLLATQKNVYRSNFAMDQWSPLAKEQHRYEALLPLEDGSFLASIRDLGLVRISPQGAVLERVPDLTPGEQYRKIARDGKGRLWAGSKRALLRIEGQPGSLRLRQEDLPESPERDYQEAVDLEVDAGGRLWVGYMLGIAWLDEGDRWRKLHTDQPLTLLRSFTLAGDDIWVAHRRDGLFSRLHRNGEDWTVTRFAASAGYGPESTDFLKRDSRGWIWRGTSKGVLISDGIHFAPSDWIHLNMGNGLASSDNNQYGFFEDIDHSVWISGEEGVSHLRPDPSWFDAPRGVQPPRITRVEVDGRVFLFPQAAPVELPADSKIVRVDVGSLNAPPFRDAPLRYRLLPKLTEWQLSSDGSLEFRNLPQNSYTLELGYAGAGASAVGAFPLRIGAGPGLSWLWVFGLLVPAGALAPVVRRRPWFERARFRLQKGIFLLQRRYRRGNPSSSPLHAGPMSDYSGEVLAGRYYVGRAISRGGFSVVYEARDIRANEKVAVKVLTRSSGDESWIRDRFAHEVSAMRSVDHPGVAPILDSWISPAGEPCLAMPFLDGETLRAVLKHGPLATGRVARLLRQLGGALSEVHGHGIIHRDLKPENLILLWPGTNAEQAVILDFGTAGLRSGENELAATTLMAGSFHYMAPERLTGRYSPASDIFSLGVIVLEMLTGKRLSDFRWTFSDHAFGGELENLLRERLGNAAAVVAARLAPAFDPEPRRRPVDVGRWAEGIAGALEGG